MPNPGQEVRNARQVLRDIKQDFDDIKTRVVTKADLIILGGHFEDESDLFAKFLGTWQSVQNHFEWQIWEAVSRLDLMQEPGKAWEPPSSLERLENVERVRIFGDAGDLFVRRDGSRLYWRFIGDNGGASWPEVPDEFNPKNYADRESDFSFYHHEETYLLWNKKNPRGNEESPEQRVSTLWRDSDLNNLSDAELYLRQRHYLEGGRVVFVRYVEIYHQLSNHEERENG